MHLLPPKERESGNNHIVDLYCRGLSLEQISERVGLKKITVYDILRKKGVMKVHDYPKNSY